MSSSPLLFILIPALPLLWALLVLLPRVRWLAAAAGVLPTLPALVAVAELPEGAGATTSWLLLGTEWRLDGTARPLLAVTALLWAAASLFAQGYLAGEARRWRFDGFFHLTMAGSLGLIVAGDPVAFYTLFALMSLASYGLVIHRGDAEALRAGRVYIILAMVGEVMLLMGLVGLAGGAAATWWPALGLGLSIKAGLLPMHIWLPLAHPVAPVPASAVLSGAMVKAGLIGWLRFPPPPEIAAYWGAVLAVLGGMGALYAGLVGLAQDRPKVVLAYSTISQMGVMAAALGLAWSLAGAATLSAVVVAYAVHHALTKGTLFLAIGWLERGGGIAARLVLWAGALAMAGLPATGGAAAKALLKGPLETLPAGSKVALSLLTASSVITVLLMARLLVVRPSSSGKGAPPSLALAAGSLAVLMLVVPWAWLPLAEGTMKALVSVVKNPVFALEPLVAAALAAVVLIRWYATWPWGPTVPVGNLMAILPGLPSQWIPSPLRFRRFRAMIRQELEAASGRLRWAEAALGAWGVMGLVLLTVAAVLGLLLGQ